MPGLDRTVLDTIDSALAIARVRRDIRTDFILAPHFDAIFLKASDELWARTHELLSSGRYAPEPVLTVAVPKARNFTRPGSILSPIDRLVYQALSDLMAPTLEAQLDRSRAFSHVVVEPGSEAHLFEPEHVCWDRFQTALRKLASKGGFFVKADVANYFERIPQHHLINLMIASGCVPEAARLLEEMLLAFQERNSFGIIQGVFPSDLFGNFYLSDIDAYCEIHGIQSLRFVDDLYLRFDSLAEARRGLIRVIDRLRQEGLHLNEYKSGIRAAQKVIREETELDRLFSETVEEIREERRSEKKVAEVVTGYGFPVGWEFEKEDGNDDEKEDEDDLSSAAIERLYESIENSPGQADKIERFCLPFLRAAGSDTAVKRALNGVAERPHLSRLYLSYLSRFVPADRAVTKTLEKLLESPMLVLDYQRMYVLGALMGAAKIDRNTVNAALRLLAQSSVGQEVRALAAIFAARHGTPQQRRTVRLSYENETSAYVRAAILYASRHFTGTERKICTKAWGGHSTTNALIGHALRSS
jgi:retron-type reverse transcriptase